STLSGSCFSDDNVMAAKPTADKTSLSAINAPRDEWRGWAQLLDDYCHYRYEEMSRLASRRDDPASELATLLWVRAVQQLNSKIALLEASQQAMERLPHCLWLQDQMYQATGVAYLHSLTRMGPPLLSDELLAQLPSVEGLPAAVESQLTDSEELDQLAIAQLATAIVEAGASDTQ